MELWPGYATSIRKHEQDILLNCDVAHKVMRMDTVYDLMQESLRADRSNFQNNFKGKALGLTVLTAYNNATYRIDDIEFDKSPMTTFDKKGTPVTLCAYYQEVSYIYWQGIFPKFESMFPLLSARIWLLAEIQYFNQRQEPTASRQQTKRKNSTWWRWQSSVANSRTLPYHWIIGTSTYRHWVILTPFYWFVIRNEFTTLRY